MRRDRRVRDRFLPNPTGRSKLKKKKEKVDHPQHYGGDTTYEVIKVLEAWGLDKDFCLGNTVKYIARSGKKSKATLIVDLMKARWYLDRKIAGLERSAAR